MELGLIIKRLFLLFVCPSLYSCCRISCIHACRFRLLALRPWDQKSIHQRLHQRSSKHHRSCNLINWSMDHTQELQISCKSWWDSHTLMTGKDLFRAWIVFQFLCTFWIGFVYTAFIFGGLNHGLHFLMFLPWQISNKTSEKKQEYTCTNRQTSLECKIWWKWSLELSLMVAKLQRFLLRALAYMTLVGICSRFNRQQQILRRHESLSPNSEHQQCSGQQPPLQVGHLVCWQLIQHPANIETIH